MVVSGAAVKMISIAVAAALVGVAGGFLAPSLWSDAKATTATREVTPEQRGVPVHGFVFDQEFYPIPNATLTVVETEVVFQSLGDGSYELDAKPGNYLIIASAPGYRSAAASILVLYGETTRHDFILEPKPVGVPYYEILPYSGLITCELWIHHQVGSVDCDAASGSPNKVVSTNVVPLSVANAIHEVFWDAQSQFATNLKVESAFVTQGTELEVGIITGPNGLTLWLLDWFLYKHRGPTSEWRNEYSIFGTGGDDVDGNKGGLLPGFAQDQSFDAYTTLFHYTPAPGNFTALAG